MVGWVDVCLVCLLGFVVVCYDYLVLMYILVSRYSVCLLCLAFIVILDGLLYRVDLLF